MWQAIIPIIHGSTRFVLTTHTNPDCDALGSELALAEHLQAAGKQVTILNSDATPPAYRFLDPKRRLRRYSPKRHNGIINNAEVIIVLDASGGWSRTGEVGNALKTAPATKLCIDHHPDPTDFVDAAVVNTDAAATGELIFDLVETMTGQVSATMAQALYAAIITDTGSFRFPKTSPQTHLIAARLIAAGADPLQIYRQIYEQNPLGVMQLKGQVMASIRTAANGQLAYYGLTRATLKAYGAKPSQLDGFASLGQQIGGVRATLFCMETGSNRVKISLRSDGSVAVNGIAQQYGGGGHPSAAGATVNGHLEAVLTEALEKLEALLAAPAA
ncbi:MAG: DHHA1 domain-containing protein [Anaerolineae bacterium]